MIVLNSSQQSLSHFSHTTPKEIWQHGRRPENCPPFSPSHLVEQMKLENFPFEEVSLWKLKKFPFCIGNLAQHLIPYSEKVGFTLWTRVCIGDMVEKNVHQFPRSLHGQQRPTYFPHKYLDSSGSDSVALLQAIIHNRIWIFHLLFYSTAETRTKLVDKAWYFAESKKSKVDDAIAMEMHQRGRS